MVEHALSKRKVVGSTPTVGSSMKNVDEWNIAVRSQPHPLKLVEWLVVLGLRIAVAVGSGMVLEYVPA